MQPLSVISEYLFRTQLGGNFGLTGRVKLKLEQFDDETELDIEIVFSDEIRSRYVRTLVEFGLLYGLETLKPFNQIKGKYRVTVLMAGFHDIDNSTITMAYTANMAIRRASDIEKGNSLLFESVRFILYKKYPINKSVK